MITEHPQFFTATILRWNNLLSHNEYKEIILNSLKFLVTNNRIFVYGFVIMPNHIHLIWQMREGINPSDVQRDFLKYTAQQMKFELQKYRPQDLDLFHVNLKDRKYQIWENRPLSIPIWTEHVLVQKLDYIHRNPVKGKWNLAELPEDYHYSSARFYILNEDYFGFITHYKG